MTSIYVKEQGARIGRRGERLVVSKQGKVLKEFPVGNLEQIVLLGNVQLTTQAVATLLAKDIDVVFLSSFGKFRGRLSGPGSKRARLRKQQLQRMGDPQIALELAKAVVDGKIHNQRVVLQRQARRTRSLPQRSQGLSANPADPQRFENALKQMMRMRKQALQAHNVDSLRGYEGKAAVYYFDAVRSLLDPAWKFEKRVYYPPTDPFNALISFGYSLLLKDVVAAVNQVGFDQYLGFFHEIAYGRPSLALDIMEEWRPVVVDALALELINRGGLLPEQFRWTGNPKRPVELGEKGVALLLKSYGNRLESIIYHPDAGPGGQTSLRNAILLQVRQLARVVADAQAGYVSLKLK